jgi:polar amino acid transport system substrate-binding protein
MKTILLLLLSSQSLFAFDVYAPKRIDNSKIRAYHQDVIIKSYNEIGIDAKMVYISENDINSRLKSGDFDAVANKISNENVIPNSIKVYPALISNYVVSRYKLKRNKTIKRKISVGVIKGVLAHTKAIIKNRARFEKVEYYDDYKALIYALYRGKIDSILMSEIIYNEQISKKIVNELEVVNKNLFSSSIFHYINKKHKKLLTKLSAVFKERKKDGTLQYKSYTEKDKKKGPLAKVGL